MTTLNKILRATVGQIVKADVTGTSLWLTGRISSFDDKTITFSPADGSDEVKMVRAEVFKATQAELDAASQSTVVTPATKVGTGAYRRPAGEVVDLPHPAFDATPTASEAYDTESAGRKNGVVDPAYIDGYTKVKSVNGNASLDNNDRVAVSLRGGTLENVYETAADALETTVEELKASYSHLNPGMARMVLGNRIRAALK